MVFNPNHVQVGPGTLYVAPLGTTEPTAVTGTWAAGWTEVGYTDQGSEFTFTPSFQEVTVEEEYWPLREAPNGAKVEMTFALAETTAQNLAIALNDGIGTALVSTTTGTNADGSLWVEPPIIGNEARLMLGWDSLIEGAVQGANPFGRIIVRQVIQTGAMKVTRRKGNNKAMYACTFSAEKPYGAQPFRFLFPAALAA